MASLSKFNRALKREGDQRGRHSVRNQRGQMAIFVALIFQVLFLFFAMAINIGLAVHDKINLQNATDLAAYYAAEKQAEMLNVIAHTNYQIRQAYKLLNFRYYYLGTMGYQDHPSGAPTVYSEGSTYGAITSNGPDPLSICIAYSPTWVNVQGDNLCKGPHTNVPNVPIPPVIAPFIPANLIFQQMAIKGQAHIAKTCNTFATFNWWYASSILMSYALDQENRKKVIRAIAANLSLKMDGNQGDMLDLDGYSIYQGAKKTFEKNLTDSNLRSHPKFELKNPLEGKSQKDWLPEIEVYFSVVYDDVVGTSNSCTAVARLVSDQPQHYDVAFLQGVFPGSLPAEWDLLHNYVVALRSFGVGDPRRLSLGVEKNPWYWVYVAAKATSTPTQMFSPTSRSTPFVARAYAQPFGGRVGPWYGKLWPNGNSESSGPQLQERAPPRLGAGGAIRASQVRQILPGYSRYPGDIYGETASNYLQSLANLFNPVSNQGGVASNFTDYASIFSTFYGGPHDSLAYRNQVTAPFRPFELAAVAPDLFDITYYSIQPNFGKKYLPALEFNADRLGIPKTSIYGDLGQRTHDPSLWDFSVKDQMKTTIDLLHKANEFWYVRKREHLLTSWVGGPNYADYFSFPVDRFGHCNSTDDSFQPSTPAAPGGCVDGGGRTGYSVKIISPEMLTKSLPLGGAGQNGTIANAIPADW